MSFKCKVSITIREDGAVDIELDNPGEIDTFTLSGVLDFVKFGLHSSTSNVIVDEKPGG